MIFLFNIHQKYSFIYMYLVKRHNKILKTGVKHFCLKKWGELKQAVVVGDPVRVR